MSILLILLLSFTYSPQDSCWKLITLGNIPERAIFFAEIAAGEGGRAAVNLAFILEIAGRFPQAERYYRMVANSADDPLLAEWLSTRILGTQVLDTLLILKAVIRNESEIAATDILVEIPLPESHPPYQRIEQLASMFRQEGNILTHHITSLPGRTEISLPLVLHITQHPYTFRPFFSLLNSNIALEDISSFIRSLPVPGMTRNPGPCLETAYLLKQESTGIELELQVVGGLLRTGSDSLLFHAWNLVSSNGMPIDAVLFQVDSLRGIGHCSTDMIPLWNYERTDGHEVSIYYPEQDAELRVAMKASFADPDRIMWILNLIPCFSVDSHQ